LGPKTVISATDLLNPYSVYPRCFKGVRRSEYVVLNRTLIDSVYAIVFLDI